MNGWAFLSENDDQLIFCRTAITHDRYLSLSQPIKHRKFIKILSCEVIPNDEISHLNVRGCNAVFCRRDPQGERRQEGCRLGQSDRESMAEQLVEVTTHVTQKRSSWLPFSWEKKYESAKLQKDTSKENGSEILQEKGKWLATGTQARWLGLSRVSSEHPRDHSER